MTTFSKYFLFSSIASFTLSFSETIACFRDLLAIHTEIPAKSNVPQILIISITDIFDMLLKFSLISFNCTSILLLCKII